jgi:hypothetical protein
LYAYDADGMIAMSYRLLVEVWQQVGIRLCENTLANDGLLKELYNHERDV